MATVGKKKTWYDHWREAYDENEEFLRDMQQFAPENSAAISRAQERKQYLTDMLKTHEF